jgi:hypothetical protein
LEQRGCAHARSVGGFSRRTLLAEPQPKPYSRTKSARAPVLGPSPVRRWASGAESGVAQCEQANGAWAGPRGWEAEAVQDSRPSPPKCKPRSHAAVDPLHRPAVARELLQPLLNSSRPRSCQVGLVLPVLPPLQGGRHRSTPDYSNPSPQGCRPGASRPLGTPLRPVPAPEAHRPLTPAWERYRNGLSDGSARRMGNGNRDGGTQALAYPTIPIQVRPAR